MHSILYTRTWECPMGRDAREPVSATRKSRANRSATVKVPPPTTTRWFAHTKAEVVTAVCNGLLSLDEACDLYELTVEEFLTWKHAFDQFGLAGLRNKHVRVLRREAEKTVSVGQILSKQKAARSKLKPNVRH